MTSIEWLALALYDNAEMKAEGGVIDQIVEQAKEMHKQEIIDAYRVGADEMYVITEQKANKYYQVMFKED